MAIGLGDGARLDSHERTMDSRRTFTVNRSAKPRLGFRRNAGAALEGVVLLLVGVGCAEPDSSVGSFTSTIVYGDDDRVEVYEHPDAELRSVAADAVVALVPKDRLRVAL